MEGLGKKEMPKKQFTRARRGQRAFQSLGICRECVVDITALHDASGEARDHPSAQSLASGGWLSVSAHHPHRERLALKANVYLLSTYYEQSTVPRAIIKERYLSRTFS